MNWRVEYSRRAAEFIDTHAIGDKIHATLSLFFAKISGTATANLDIKKLKGGWAGFFRLRKGKLRIIVRVEPARKTVFVDVVDFRGNVYK